MGLVLMMLAVMLFAFSVLGAAMLTQPPVAKIEEMGGFLHMRSEISRAEISQGYRRESADSDKRTGTDIRRPFRQMCTCTVSPI